MAKTTLQGYWPQTGTGIENFLFPFAWSDQKPNVSGFVQPMFSIAAE